MTKLRIEFTGRNEDDIKEFGQDDARYIFLNRFFTDFLKFLHPEEVVMLDEDLENWGRIPKASNIWHTFKEAIKNIYDHNGAWGYCELERLDNGSIGYKIGNTQNPTPETNEHQPSSRVNYGVGITWMKNLDGATLDIEAGYVYTGTYQIPH